MSEVLVICIFCDISETLNNYLEGQTESYNFFYVLQMWTYYFKIYMETQADFYKYFVVKYRTFDINVNICIYL